MAISKKNKIIIGVGIAAIVTAAVLIPVLLTRGSKSSTPSTTTAAATEEARLTRLAKFHMYANTARDALDEMRAFMKENGIAAPIYADLSGKKLKSGKTGPRICVGVQTASRQASPINYVEQTVGGLLARMTLPNDDVYIHVFNVQNLSQVHKDVEAIQDLVPVTRTKGDLPVTIRVPWKPQFAESHDHREVMRVFKRVGCQYPILIEDDALPQENWLDMVNLAIRQLEERGTDWFLVKMYVAREEFNDRPDKSYVGITDYDQTFNGVAMMYNPKYMLKYGDALVHHTREVMAGRLSEKFYEFKDTYLNVYKKEHNVKIEAFEPPIFQHTGIYSSVNVRPLEQFPWFMETREFVSQDKPIVFNSALWSGYLTKKN